MSITGGPGRSSGERSKNGAIGRARTLQGLRRSMRYRDCDMSVSPRRRPQICALLHLAMPDACPSRGRV